ncbi:MAG: tetratricopeptide repeat protein [Candidatus Delongbacteria bacterium]|jgi:outer membrane protein assembly factor BamD (BamD/ComL family)|nr:tetratricopeptide repeat protein [Candidatus Delongbacteria bacterium]
MKNKLLTILIGFLIAINVITITSCSSSQKIASNNDFLYMEEVYAYAKKYYSEGNWEKCINWYEKLENDYPDNTYMDETLFIRGYINKAYLNKSEKAEKYFNILILNYPDSQFSSSAEFELKHMNDPDFVPNFEK